MQCLGSITRLHFELVDDEPDVQQPPPDIDQLIQTSLKQRPDLQVSQFSDQAAVKFSHAQRDQLFPSIAAAGTVGTVPIRQAQYYATNWWGAIGVNMNIPIFNGFLYTSQAKEASLRAQAAAEQTRDLRDRIVRDVSTAWLAANTSYQRVSVTAELLQEANLGLKLAQTRYQMGLSSIVELSQAEYQQTDAAIGNANAQYQYRMALGDDELSDWFRAIIFCRRLRWVSGNRVNDIGGCDVDGSYLAGFTWITPFWICKSLLSQESGCA